MGPADSYYQPDDKPFASAVFDAELLRDEPLAMGPDDIAEYFAFNVEVRVRDGLARAFADGIEVELTDGESEQFVEMVEEGWW